VKMRRCFTDPHYWKNPALRRSREKRTTSSGNGRPMAPESNSGSMFPCIGRTYASHMHPYGASALIFKFYRRSSKSRHEAAIRIGATQFFFAKISIDVGIPSLRKVYTELLRLGFVEHQQFPHALWGDCYCYVNSLIVRWRAIWGSLGGCETDPQLL